MNFDPLLQASPAIQIHVYAAVAAFFLGAAILFRRKGGRVHKALGRIWVGLMLVVAVSSFFIHTINLWGIWSPIHLISVGTLFSLGYGVWLVRRRIVIGHQRVMQGTYFGALIVAGIFTFLPDRIMYEVLFEGPSPAVGVAVMLFILAAGGALAWRGLRGARRTRPGQSQLRLPAQ